MVGLVCAAAACKTTPTVSVEPPRRASAASQAAPEATPAAAVPAAKVGETVRFDDSTWTVVKAENLGSTVKSNNQFQPALKSDGGSFVRVVIKVTNLGKTEERLFQQPMLVDTQGREFKPVDMSIFYIPEGKKTLQLEAIPPSLPKEFWEVYEVAGDSAGLRFLARQLAAGGGTHPIDLGLDSAAAARK